MPLIRCTNVFYKGDYPVTQVNILLLDSKFSHFLFITDYKTVAEAVDIVAK